MILVSLQNLIALGCIIIVAILAVVVLAIVSRKMLKSFRFKTIFASFEAEFETNAGR